MASRKGKNIAKKKLIAKVKGVQYIPKTPRNKKQKVQVAPVKEHQGYAKAEPVPIWARQVSILVPCKKTEFAMVTVIRDGEQVDVPVLCRNAFETGLRDTKYVDAWVPVYATNKAGAVKISRNHNGGKKKEYVKRLYKQKQHVPKRKYAADDPVVPATELMDRILQRKLAMLEPRSPKAA